MKQATAVEWLYDAIDNELIDFLDRRIDLNELSVAMLKAKIKAKAMEKEQIGYSKEDVLKAGEIGEINHHDYKHIVKLLDEAKEINQSLKQPKQ